MPFNPLELEEWHSRYEREVTCNLDSSGVPALRLSDLVVDPVQAASLAALTLDYPPTAGTERLRELIADWSGTTADRVLVTVGAAEANEIAVMSTVGPGDRVVVFEPGYRQVGGAAANLGADVVTVPLNPGNGWRVDSDALRRAMRPHTRVVAVTNPSNPLGTVLTVEERAEIVAAAEQHGAWLLVDETFRGSERIGNGTVPASLADQYERVIAVGSLSKAFGLPGLRIGWLIAPPPVLEAACRRHEYAVIAAGTVSLHLAESALEPATRARLLRRGREAIERGYGRLKYWIDSSEGLLSVIEPQATATSFVHYALDVPSIEVAQALRIRARTLVGVGAHFGGEYHLRIGHTVPGSALDEGMASLMEVLRSLSSATHGGMS